MDISTSNAVVMSNREFFQQRKAAALRRIPGAQELLGPYANQHTVLEKKYPDASFALKIISNTFIPDRELGAIQMEAYSSILNGEAIAGVH